MAVHCCGNKLWTHWNATAWFIELTLVLIPIQLRYLDNFFEMYVLPLAGRPTRAMTCGVDVDEDFLPTLRLPIATARWKPNLQCCNWTQIIRKITQRLKLTETSWHKGRRQNDDFEVKMAALVETVIGNFALKFAHFRHTLALSRNVNRMYFYVTNIRLWKCDLLRADIKTGFTTFLVFLSTRYFYLMVITHGGGPWHFWNPRDAIRIGTALILATLGMAIRIGDRFTSGPIWAVHIKFRRKIVKSNCGCCNCRRD